MDNKLRITTRDPGPKMFKKLATRRYCSYSKTHVVNKDITLYMLSKKIMDRLSDD